MTALEVFMHKFNDLLAILDQMPVEFRPCAQALNSVSDVSRLRVRRWLRCFLFRFVNDGFAALVSGREGCDVPIFTYSAHTIEP